MDQSKFYAMVGGNQEIFLMGLRLVPTVSNGIFQEKMKSVSDNIPWALRPGPTDLGMFTLGQRSISEQEQGRLQERLRRFSNMGCSRSGTGDYGGHPTRAEGCL